MCMYSWCAYEGKSTTWGNWLSSVMWIPGIKLKVIGYDSKHLQTFPSAPQISITFDKRTHNMIILQHFLFSIYFFHIRFF